MDVFSKEKRSEVMQLIRSKDTKPEVKLAKALWSKGYRYRKNDKSVFGKPDFVFKSLKIAIFCDGEFWHGKEWNKRKNRIGSNRKYWIPKIERNIQRDKEVNNKLKQHGWIVLRFWSNNITKNNNKCINSIVEAIELRKKK